MYRNPCNILDTFGVKGIDRLYLLLMLIVYLTITPNLFITYVNPYVY